MASVALMIGGALTSAAAFGASNYLFGLIDKRGADGERKRHDVAVEKYEAAKEAWAEKRAERLDFLSERRQRQMAGLKSVREDVSSMQQYAEVVSGDTTPEPLPPEPKFSDFYTPSEGQRTRELTFIVLGVGALTAACYLIF